MCSSFKNLNSILFKPNILLRINLPYSDNNGLNGPPRGVPSSLVTEI